MASARRPHAPVASTSRLAGPPSITSTGPAGTPKTREASRKGKERAVAPTPEDGDARFRQWDRKRARRAAKVEADLERRSSDEAEENDADGEGEDESEEITLTWTDLPLSNGKRRVPAQVRALELGGYRSALLDAVNNRTSLGQALLDLDRLAKSTRQDEDRVRLARDNNSSPPTDDEDDEDPVYPYPTSHTLSLLTNWPLHPSQFPPSEPLTSALLSLFASVAQSLNPPRPRRNPKTRPKNAYAQSAPLNPTSMTKIPHARIRSSSASSSSSRATSPTPSSYSNESESTLFEDSSDLDSSLDDPIPPDDFLPRVESILDGVLDRVASAVPRGPLPPLDWWDQKARRSSEKSAETARMKLRRRRGKGDPSGKGTTAEAVGWETVVGAVKERNDISPA